MPVSSVMPVPAGAKGAGLVAVDGRTYPLESVRVVARAEGGVAATTLTQIYRNPYAEPLEVLYRLPLPADGAVVGYAIRLGDRLIRGEVRRREDALAAYHDALFEGRTAALLEQERDDTFTQRLGSLPAGARAEITIEVLQPLAFLPGDGAPGLLWEYRFPTVAGVRYEGAPGRVPDAARLDVDRAGGEGAIPARVELSITIADGRSAGPLGIASPSHPIVCESTENGPVVRLGESARLDRDLVVRWRAGADEVGVRCIEGPGLQGDDGRYGLLTITPPAAPRAAFARDLAILIDASGSMSGAPLGWAAEVACGLIGSLGARDRFSVTAFASRPTPLTRGAVDATERNVAAAVKAIRELQAGGATEMADAVFAALEPLGREAQRQVVLLTDGYIGFEREVVTHVRRSLPEGSRLHAVGVGAAPNRTLTAGAARAGRGVEAFVCGDDEVAGTIARLVAATARPVLTGVVVEGSGVRAFAPARPRDVFAGQPLILALEIAPGGGTIAVRGRIAGQDEPWVWTGTVAPAGAVDTPGARLTSVPAGALFGRETVADLELDRVDAEDEAGHDLAIERTALRHRIASRRTSLVALAEEPTVDPRAPRRSTVLPVEVPAFVSAEGVGLQSVVGRATLFDACLVEDLALRRPASAPTLERRMRGGWLDRLRGRWVGEAEEPREAAVPEIYFQNVGQDVDLGEAEVIRVEGRTIVIEWRVDADGRVLPEGPVEIEVAGRARRTGAIDASRSSPRGPHESGLVVRIAIEAGGDDAWPAGGAVTLTWTADGVTFRLACVVPGGAAPGSPGA